MGKKRMDDLLNEFSLSFQTVIFNLSFFLFKMFLNTFYNYLFSISSLFLSYSSQEPVRISGWRVSFESSALKLLYFDWRFLYCRCLVLILTRLLSKFNTSKEVKRYLWSLFDKHTFSTYLWYNWGKNDKEYFHIDLAFVEVWNPQINFESQSRS